VKTNEAKPGWRTTEFALALAVLSCATVLIGLGKLDATAWGVAAGAVSAGYSHGRGKAKGEGL